MKAFAVVNRSVRGDQQLERKPFRDFGRVHADPRPVADERAAVDDHSHASECSGAPQNLQRLLARDVPAELRRTRPPARRQLLAQHTVAQHAPQLRG